MSDLIEADSSKAKRNPMLWIVLVVLGLIGYIFLGTERGNPVVSKPGESNYKISGDIDRGVLVPPGMRARQFIEQLRARGQPYALDDAFDKASEYHSDGSLADAHLLYFFAAREGHVDSMMKMAEMSDPNLFQAENSLLDHADVLQSYKWYQKAAEQGQVDVDGQIRKLQLWAQQESESGNPDARQLLQLVR